MNKHLHISIKGIVTPLPLKKYYVGGNFFPSHLNNCQMGVWCSVCMTSCYHPSLDTVRRCRLLYKIFIKTFKFHREMKNFCFLSPSLSIACLVLNGNFTIFFDLFYQIFTFQQLSSIEHTHVSSCISVGSSWYSLQFFFHSWSRSDKFSCSGPPRRSPSSHTWTTRSWPCTNPTLNLWKQEPFLTVIIESYQTFFFQESGFSRAFLGHAKIYDW